MLGAKPKATAITHDAEIRASARNLGHVRNKIVARRNQGPNPRLPSSQMLLKLAPLHKTFAKFCAKWSEGCAGGEGPNPRATVILTWRMQRAQSDMSKKRECISTGARIQCCLRLHLGGGSSTRRWWDNAAHAMKTLSRDKCLLLK